MKKIFIILIVLVSLFAVYSYSIRSASGRPADGRLHIYILDVGQGDASLIVTPSGKQILIDAGPANHAIIKPLAAVMPHNDKTLDMTIATHPDMDHIGGFVDVLSRYSVVNLVDNAVAKSTPEAIAWRSAEESQVVSGKSKILHLYRGQYFDTGDGVRLRILHPDKSDPFSDTNNNSVTVRLEYGDFSALFTGDMDAVVEMDMIQRLQKSDLDIDVLKVAHHGSKYSSSLAFLRYTTPRLAVISVACKNDYGHPHPAALRRYRYFRIPVMTTCQNKTIEIVSTGKGFHIEAKR
jgi:competence protein ComEC